MLLFEKDGTTFLICFQIFLSFYLKSFFLFLKLSTNASRLVHIKKTPLKYENYANV